MIARKRPIAAILILILLTTALVAGASHASTTAQSGAFVDSGQALTTNALKSALGDLDGDGDLDAVLATETGTTYWVNNGSGDFTDAGQSLGNAYTVAVALGDLDGDGDLDIFSLEDTASGNRVWLNQGGNQAIFTASGQVFGDGMPGNLALGDLDGDGDLDAFVVRSIGRPNQVWLNDGNGSFTDSGQNLGTGDSGGVALGDLDNDGDLDAFVADGAVNTVWLNQGGAQGGNQGVYTDSGQTLAGALAIGVALGDIDGDGDLDAATANVNSGVRLWLNLGGMQAGTAGVFAAGSLLGTAGNRDVSLSDIDGDGDRDLFAARVGANTVWLNQGGVQAGTAAVFADSGQLLGNLFSASATLADLDGDNDADALVTNINTAAQIWRNEGLSGQQTAYRIRDDILAGTIRGQRYIALCSDHSPEVIRLMLADPALFNSGYDTLIQWLPGLQTMVDGSGGNAEITQPQVDMLEAFLDDVAAKGSDELRQTLAIERAAQPNLDSLVGRTMEEARGIMLDIPTNRVYLPMVSQGGEQPFGQAHRQSAASQAIDDCFLICLLGGACQ